MAPLRADVALLASLVESSADAIVSVSPAGTILSWNPAAEELLELSAADAVGGDMADVLRRTDDLDTRRGLVAQVCEERRTLRYEATRRTVGGADVVLSVALSPVVGADATCRAVCAVIRDVTAHRAMDDRLRRLAAIVESFQDPVVTLALDRRVTSWNPAAERMYGIPPSQAIGEDIWASTPDPDGDRARMQARVAAGETVIDYEGTRTTADGRRLQVSITGFPIRNDEGAVIATAFIVRDVTEHRRVEEELRHTQRIEAIGRLAGGIAHDFNNLLTVITGYGAIAQAHVDDDEGASALREVQRAAARATELTGRLLDFARQRTTHAVLLDLGETVRGLLPMLERLIGEDVRIVSLIGDEDAPVLADRGQIEQVVVNLVVNARDAMPEGGTLTVETHAATFRPAAGEEATGLQAGRYAVLTVTDTGAGIDPAVAAHLFEPFFTTKEVGKGTGLGLATVHGIVGQAGGDVRVRSEPGMGASFTVHLPVADATTAPVPPPAETAREACARRSAAGGRERILLCEDEEPLRALMDRILCRAGYEVLVAPTPLDALELVREDRPVDVLVTDVIMPGMTGPELAARLADDHRPLRTLFLSGYTADVLKDRGRLPRGSAFMEKPFDPDGLLEAVRTLLDQPVVTSEPGRA